MVSHVCMRQKLPDLAKSTLTPGSKEEFYLEMSKRHSSMRYEYNYKISGYCVSHSMCSFHSVTNFLSMGYPLLATHAVAKLQTQIETSSVQPVLTCNLVLKCSCIINFF